MGVDARNESAAMVEIVELRQGELPPEPKFRMVECSPDPDMPTIPRSSGTIVVVPEHLFDTEVAANLEKARQEGLSKLYVVRPSQGSEA